MQGIRSFQFRKFQVYALGTVRAAVFGREDRVAFRRNFNPSGFYSAALLAAQNFLALTFSGYGQYFFLAAEQEVTPTQLTGGGTWRFN
jgi:hypothetical protein